MTFYLMRNIGQIPRKYKFIPHWFNKSLPIDYEKPELTRNAFSLLLMRMRNCINIYSRFLTSLYLATQGNTRPIYQSSQTRDTRGVNCEGIVNNLDIPFILFSQSTYE